MMNRKYKKDQKDLVLMLSVCLVVCLISIVAVIKFYSIRLFIGALVCTIAPSVFLMIFIILSGRDYVEIHDDFFIFKQGRRSPQKVYWKEISGIAFSGNKHFLHFSAVNVFEENSNMELRTIVLLDSTYEQYKKMWEDIIAFYIKSQPESHNVDAKFWEFLSL